MENGDIIIHQVNGNTYRLINGLGADKLGSTMGLALMQSVEIDAEGNVLNEGNRQGYNQIHNFKKWEPKRNWWRKIFKK